MLYEFKKSSKASETARKVNDLFGEDSVSERQTTGWFRRRRSGDETLENGEGRGRHTVLDDDRLRPLVEEDPLKTVRELAEELGVRYSTVGLHLKKMGKQKVDTSRIGYKGKTEPFFHRSMLLLGNKNDPFLDLIITCDEKWLLYDNRKRSEQWLDKNEPAKKFPKSSLHPRRVMVTVWWSATGLIY